MNARAADVVTLWLKDDNRARPLTPVSTRELDTNGILRQVFVDKGHDESSEDKVLLTVGSIKSKLNAEIERIVDELGIRRIVAVCLDSASSIWATLEKKHGVHLEIFEVRFCQLDLRTLPMYSSARILNMVEIQEIEKMYQKGYAMRLMSTPEMRIIGARAGDIVEIKQKHPLNDLMKPTTTLFARVVDDREN